MPITYIPYPVEGEILEVQEKGEKDRNVVRYTCSILNRDGSEMFLHNVEECSTFGGIADYYRFRLRARDDNSDYPTNDEQDSFSDGVLNASVGDRVLIMFVNANLNHPIIVAKLQHPNQTDEFEAHDSIKPQAVRQYLGIRETWDKDGQYRLVHKKAPEIKYSPKSAFGELAGAAAGALSSATSSISEKIIGKSNPAIEDPEEGEITLYEFLNTGIFRVRDSKGGMFELDHNKNRVYISDNDLKATEDPEGGPLSGGLQIAANATDAEYLLLDRDKKWAIINAREVAQIYSFNKRKDVTEGNHTHKIKGNSEWILSGSASPMAGNVSWEIAGKETKNIEKDRTITISGDDKLTVSGDQTIDVTGNVMLKAAGSIDIKTDSDFGIIASGEYSLKSDQDIALVANGMVAIESGDSFGVMAGNDSLIEIDGDLFLEATSNIVIEASTDIRLETGAGAVLSLESGMVALGNSSAELVEQCIAHIDALLNNASSIVLTSVGPGQLSPAAVTELTQAKIKLTSIKGSI